MATKKKGGHKKAASASVRSRTAAMRIEPAKGKLGVMVVGMGAVATTMIAGVEAVRRGLAKPIGSLTQMGTIRLGKRTDNNSPLIKDFVPLANLKDIVFTGWDIFEDNVYEAAAHAQVLKSRHAQATQALSRKDQAHARGLRSLLRQAPQRHAREEGQEQARPGRAVDGRHSRLQANREPRGRDLVRFDRDFPEAVGRASVDRGLRKGIREERSRASRLRRFTPTRR